MKALPSKRYQASYIGPDLLRHYAPHTFTSKLDAEHWVAEERRVLERGEWTPPSVRAAAQAARGQTFGEYAKVWIAQRDLKPRTRQGYEELLAAPLRRLHPVPLAMITPATVRTWHSGLGSATPRRRAHAYGLLRAIMSTAVADGLLTANPCQLRGAQNTPTKRAAIVLTPNEIAKIAINIRPAPLKAAVLIMAWAGLRWGELIELRRKDIDIDAAVIHVGRAATHRNKQCWVDSPKSGRIRTVTLPPHIVGDLSDHLAAFVDDDPEALLFCAPHACHYNDRTFRDHFAEAVATVGKSGVRIHDLRHTAATTASKVASQAALQARMGHSTASASARYQHVASGEDRAIAHALSALAATLDADSATG
ncbi:site-specific integrase [Mycobacterium sp. 29Ha]|uniref:tyrosine-type recombinase/integrase n=1 Tax=Mycobacterium sp. 29Ha TaxID=2939268 RepID=UPI00293922FA|nr:site-specific integrase [Mycobacterium sp. 29Ha]MDV3134111.1 site-specific integrase [Mycobacterium sp. 29Ha]